MKTKIVSFLVNGPLIKNISLINYTAGNLILFYLIKLKVFHKIKKKEIDMLKHICLKLNFNEKKIEQNINLYLFYNLWNNWRLHSLEKEKKYLKIVNTDSFDLIPDLKILCLLFHSFSNEAGLFNAKIRKKNIMVIGNFTKRYLKYISLIKEKSLLESKEKIKISPIVYCKKTIKK